MGLISKIKELFNKNIECDQLDNHIVYFLDNKKYLYLNKNIFVSPGTACVIVYKYKACDVIFEGKHRINADSIPETYARAKIQKLSSSGRTAKKIRADIYFVNLKEFDYFAYESDEPFCVKSNALGRVKGYLEGTCTVRVLDAKDLVKALINETGKEKTKDAPIDIGLWIGNKINKLIEKNKIPTNMVLSDGESVEKVINTDMLDALDKIGLVVTNVKLKAVNFPKKYQGKVNEYMAKNRSPIKSLDISTNFGATSSPSVKVTVNAPATQPLHSTMQTSKKPPEEAKFIVCPICKHSNSHGTKFCNNCGNKL